MDWWWVFEPFPYQTHHVTCRLFMASGCRWVPGDGGSLIDTTNDYDGLRSQKCVCGVCLIPPAVVFGVFTI